MSSPGGERRLTLRAGLMGRNPQGFLPVAMIIASSQFAWTSMIPLLPSYSTSRGVDTAQVGAVIAGFGVGRLMVNLPAGLFAGRARALLALGSGAIGVSVATATASLVDSFIALITIRVVMGLAAGLALTCGLAIVGKLTDAGTRGRMVSKLQFIQLVGTTSGPVTGGLLASRFGAEEALVATGGVGVLVSLVAYQRARSTPYHQREAAVGKSGRDRPDRKRHPVALGSLLAASGVGFAVFLARFGGEQTLIPLMGEDLGLDVSELGVLLSALSLCQAAGVVINSRIYDRAPKKRVVIISLAILALAVLGVGLASTLAVFVLMAMLMGIAQGFAVPASSAYLIDVTPRSQMGMAIGVYRTFGDTAAVLGPLAVGILIVAAGGQLAAAVLAGCVLAILVVFARFAVEPDSTSLSDVREERHDGT